jgi:hypothetical protein
MKRISMNHNKEIGVEDQNDELISDLGRPLVAKKRHYA